VSQEKGKPTHRVSKSYEKITVKANNNGIELGMIQEKKAPAFSSSFLKAQQID